MTNSRQAIRRIFVEASPQALKASADSLGLNPDVVELYLSQADPTEDHRFTSYILSQWNRGIIYLPRDEKFVKDVLKKFQKGVGVNITDYESIVDAYKTISGTENEDTLEILMNEGIDIKFRGNEEEEVLLAVAESGDHMRLLQPMGKPKASISGGWSYNDDSYYYPVVFVFKKNPKAFGASPVFPYEQIAFYSEPEYEVYLTSDPRKNYKDVMQKHLETGNVAKMYELLTKGDKKLDLLAFAEMSVEDEQSIKNLVSPASTEFRENYKEWLQKTKRPPEGAVEYVMGNNPVALSDSEVEEFYPLRKDEFIYTDVGCSIKGLSGGDTVSKSNRSVFRKEYGMEDGVYVYSGEVIVTLGCQNPGVWEMIQRLDDYPVIDDMALSDQENEESMESWNGWYSREFYKYLEDTFVDSFFDDPNYDAVADAFNAKSEDDLYQFFETIRDRVNEYWEPQSDGGMHIDMRRITKDIDNDDFAEYVGLPEYPQWAGSDEEEDTTVQESFRDTMRKILDS